MYPKLFLAETLVQMKINKEKMIMEIYLKLRDT